MKWTDLSFSDLGWVLNVLNFLILVGGGAFGFYLRHKFVGRGDFDRVRARVGDLEVQAEAGHATKTDIADLSRRLGELETQERVGAETLKGLATKDDVARIEQVLAVQDGERKALAATVNALNHAVEKLGKPIDLIYEHLLNAKDKS